MKDILFHDLAIKELNDARDYYDSVYLNLGQNFVLEIEAALIRIKNLPLSFPVTKSKIRKATVKKFPYSILFRLEGKEIFILAVMHQKRRPDYWIERIKF